VSDRLTGFLTNSRLGANLKVSSGSSAVITCRAKIPGEVEPQIEAVIIFFYFFRMGKRLSLSRPTRAQAKRVGKETGAEMSKNHVFPARGVNYTPKKKNYGAGAGFKIMCWGARINKPRLMLFGISISATKYAL